MASKVRARQNDKILRPVLPNAGLRVAYQKKIDRLIDEMHASVTYWLTAAFRANEPLIAQDESPATALRAAIRRLTKRWLARFDDAAPELAKYFATAVSERSDATLRKILKDGGFSVEFKMTAAQRDVLNATIGENVSLIKSIPQRYLSQVEQSVMRSVQAGRDLGALSKELREHFGVTKRRAALLSLDQNNKATAALTRARQIETGITEAVWVHSGGGKHPRESHVKAGRDKQRYDVREGWLDPEVGKRIFPGELISCRCVCRSVVRGFS